MKEIKTGPIAISIWLLATGYFLFYIPYSALTKLLTSTFFDQYGIYSGLAFLPIILMGTLVTMPLIIFFLGWYRYTGEHDSLRPRPSWRMSSTLSGIAFAFIIATTTLAYSFQGVSILFALLLMRGGVLIMSPIIDTFFSHHVHWYSWLGLASSVAAVSFALLQVNEYSLNWIVLANLSLYLLSYFFRLRFITQYAKDAHEAVNRRFFVEENISAMIGILLLVIASLAYYLYLGYHTFSSYISTMNESNAIWLGLLVGIFYGCLGVFGSLIYLNRRENTFAIPVNRCVSLLSGIVASLILALFLSEQVLSTSQLVAISAILFTLMIMLLFDKREEKKQGHGATHALQRVWLFICDGNRMRSPMAAAICNKLLKTHIRVEPSNKLKKHINDRKPDIHEIYAESAALRLGNKRSLPEGARMALADTGIPIGKHQAQQVTPRQVQRAEKIFCMNAEQRKLIISQFPWTAAKVFVLGSNEGISKPSGSEKQHYLDLAFLLKEQIQRLLPAKKI